MRNRTFADVSNNNGQSLDLHAYKHKGGHILIGVKASEGTTFTDHTHAGRAHRAHEAGVVVIHYHFGHPGSSATEQAKHFWDQVKPVHSKKDYCCLDIEVTDGMGTAHIKQWVKDFVAHFHKISGHQLVIYSGQAFLQEHGPIRPPGARFWVAAYGPREAHVYWVKRLWAWQYTDGRSGPRPHAVAGIGHCDLSRLNRRTFLWLLRP